MYIPRYFQTAAADHAVQELRLADRATVVMCCGTGKTYIGALIALQMDANIRVVVAPTIMLGTKASDN